MNPTAAVTRLPPCVFLDGEAVVYITDDQGSTRISGEAVQSRALSGLRRAREVAARHAVGRLLETHEPSGTPAPGSVGAGDRVVVAVAPAEARLKSWAAQSGYLT